MLIDGNDPAVVYTAVREAVSAARRGDGPTLIEAQTYRIEAHTNADDATRYRSQDEVLHWLARDPIDRLEHHLIARSLLDDAARTQIASEAESFAASLRERMNADPVLDPGSLFEYVYATPTPALHRQAAALAAELGAPAVGPGHETDTGAELR
jgi:pyruvate dehydrogenase E1 component alpha subunit